MPLILSDVMCTGNYGAEKAAVTRGDTVTVTVIGDGTVGLSAVLALSAKRLAAEQIVLMGGQPPARPWS